MPEEISAVVETAGVEESAPAEQTETAGVEEPEVAAPAEGKTERDAEYANIRRRAEAEARANAVKDMDAMVAKLGLVSTLDDKPIKTYSEALAYNEALARNRIQQQLEYAGLSDDEIGRMVDQHPDVMAARTAAAEYTQAAQEAADLRGRLAMQEEIGKISEYDPNIKTLDDLLALPDYSELFEMVKRGYRVSHAYFCLRQDSLLGKIPGKTAESSAKTTAGKAHLTGTAVGRGGSDDSIPSEVMSAFRATYPGISDDEIAKKFRAYVKNMRR